MRFAIVVALLAVSSWSFADEDKPEVHTFRFIERGQFLTVTANPTPLAKLFDSAAYESLDSGFTSTVVIRLWVYPKGSSDAVAFLLLQRQVLYNLWDEVFELRIDGRAPIKEKRQSEALKKLTAIDDIAVARLARLPFDQVYLLAMQVELNPVSKETLAEVWRWLSQGTGGGLDRGGAFFGSFVSVFVNPKIPEADRVLRIRSQPFYRPKP
ncbi:MAG TPA: hypothetical protein VK427_04290 [Kofleriaceae bacterium]|nr:hypothetical protein [Kofleriaceae bacterium]